VSRRDLEPILGAVARARDRSDRPVLVALDGRSGAGKSTVANRLVSLLDARLVSGDDFYAGGTDAEWGARSASERLERAFDWRRMRAEALEPLLAGQSASWLSFNWQSWEGLSDEVVACEAGPVIVLDVVYSGRPELSDLVDIAVLLTLDDRERRARLVSREGAPYMARWQALWESAEDYYFSSVRKPDSFDAIITAGS
jgi:uridine kinase